MDQKVLLSIDNSMTDLADRSFSITLTTPEEKNKFMSVIANFQPGISITRKTGNEYFVELPIKYSREQCDNIVAQIRQRYI